MNGLTMFGGGCGREAGSKYTPSFSHSEALEGVRRAASPADLLNNATVISWTFDDSVQFKGDGSTSYISSIKVGYSIDDEGFETNYVVKINPSQADGETSEMSQGIFKTEDLFYTQLVPLLNQQLTDVGAQALRFPKIFFAINSEDCQFMIMENLKTSGFARRNKRLGLDAPHTRLVVQELGRFNAASLILEKSLGTKIEDKYPRFKGKLWSESMKFLGPWMSSLFEDTISLAKKEGSKYDGVQRWLENAKKTPLELLDQNLQDDAAQFSVLGHNDCWTANLMFRYTKDDEPEDVRLFDFQAPRKTSVAIDLNNLFYNSMNGTNRKAHRKELLSLYYNSFSAILSSKGQSPPFTLQELDDECHRKMIHGVLYGIMFTKMAIGAPVDQGDWNVFEEAKDGESQATIKGNNNEEEVRQRFLDLFEDMIQFDIVA